MATAHYVRSLWSCLLDIVYRLQEPLPTKVEHKYIQTESGTFNKGI